MSPKTNDAAPKAKKGSNGQPAAPKPQAAPKPAAARKPAAKKSEAKPILHPELKTVWYLRTNENGPITAAMMKEWIGWESESDAVAKLKGEVDDKAKAAVKASFAGNYLLEDANGEKVRCWKNLSNRELRLDGVKRLMQDILNRRWADSINTPEGTPPELARTPNGETIVIGRHGNALSIQHRALALILAAQEWAKPTAYHWHELWPEEPTIEGGVTFGVSEDQATLATIDNTIPRTDADVIATAGIFADLPAAGRRACNRALGYATKMLWSRTGADDDAFVSKRTNSEVIDFVNRHPHIVQAVRSLYALETAEGHVGSVTSILSLGYASATLYLMGCSASDGERNGRDQLLAYADAEPMPNEGTARKPLLDWSRWDQALEFWTMMANNDKPVQCVRHARRPVEGATREDPLIGHVFSEHQSGSLAEKLAMLARGWFLFAEGRKITDSAMKLTPATFAEQYDVDYNEDGTIGSVTLVASPSFGGIDLGDPAFREKPERTKDGDEGDEAGSNGEGDDVPATSPQPAAPPKPMDLKEELVSLRQAHPGKVLLFEGKTTYRAWEEDAEALREVVGFHTQKDANLGMVTALMPRDAVAVATAKLMEAGHAVGLVRFVNGQAVVEDQGADGPANEEPTTDDAVETEPEDVEEDLEVELEPENKPQRKPRPGSRAAVEAAQTEKARKADEEMAREKAAK